MQERTGLKEEGSGGTSDPVDALRRRDLEPSAGRLGRRLHKEQQSESASSPSLAYAEQKAADAVSYSTGVVHVGL